MSPALAVRGLRKSYGGTEVLAAYAIVAFYVATVLTRRRLLT